MGRRPWAATLSFRQMRSRTASAARNTSSCPRCSRAIAVNTGVGTDDSGDLLNNLQGATTQALINAATQFYQQTVTNTTPPNGPAKGQAPVFQAAAALAIDKEDNTATAGIGAGTAVRVSGNLTVDANTNDRPNVIASSGISEPTNNGGGGGTEFDGSVAVALGFYTNTATATIDTDASVDVGKKLAVTSEALNDFQLSYGVNLYQAAAQQPTHKTDEAGANAVTINPSDIVEIESNHTGNGPAGHWYQFVGAGSLTNVDLTSADFSNTSLWNDLGPRLGIQDRQRGQDFHHLPRQQLRSRQQSVRLLEPGDKQQSQRQHRICRLLDC